MQPFISPRHFCLVFLAGAFWLGSPRQTLGQPNLLTNQVKLIGVQAKPIVNGVQEIQIILEVEKGFCVFGNPVGWNDLEGGAARVKVSMGGKEVDAKILYPVGFTRNLGGMDIQLYRDRIIIPCLVPRQPGDQRPVEIAAHFQGMHETLAY